MREGTGTVKETGAHPGATLEGSSPANVGMRLRVHRAQPAGNGGRVQGSLTLVAAGHGPYASHLKKLVGDDFSAAAELLDELGSDPAAAKVRHILNANLLRVVKD